MASSRAEIGFVFQRFNLFPHLSAVDNVALAPKRVRGLSQAEARDVAAAMLEKVGVPFWPDAAWKDVVFAVAPPDAAGGCQTGTQPLYRLYNDGKGAAPNHRYTTSASTRSAMIGQGWIPEGVGPLGVIACVPV